MSRRISLSLFAALVLIVAPAAKAQAPNAHGPTTITTDKTTDLMRQMSASFETLVNRVSPAVVEVEVTGFGSDDDDDDNGSDSKSTSIGRQRSLGSGVVVDPDGYIITNYHVVKGAERVRVVLTPQTTTSQPTSFLKSRGKILPAKIVGFSKRIDLAVLKVEATNLPTLQIGRYEKIQKGQLVLAFGSPEGLE